MFRIPNRYLPQWLHRLFNGVFVLTVSITFGVVGVTGFSRVPVLQWLFAGLLFGSPLLAIAAVFLADRLSAVEGIAGPDGYDELSGSEERAA